MLSQMVDSGSELLQGFPGELAPFQLRVERFFQVVVTLAIRRRHRNLLVRLPTREASRFKAAIRYVAFSQSAQ